MATITGTSGNDTIIDGSGADTILGLAGNDSLSGNGGDDILRGGTGNDMIDGGSGADLIDFSDATGGINFTLVQSSSYTNVNLTGVGLGTDSYKNIEGVIATNFNDTLTGSTLNDVLSGGAGNDILRGRAGNDTIDGGSGTDLIDFSDATGGINFTLVQSSSSTSVNLSGVGLGTDTYKNIEGVIGTNFTDTLSGSSNADTIYGGGGNDTILGGSGNDILRGGAGNDTIDGGSGTDLIDFSDATGGITFTLVQSSSSTSVNLSGVGLGTDTYKNIEGVIGTNFADMLTGSGYADTIYGGGGGDTVVGGLAGDLLTGGSGADVFAVTTNNNNTVSDSLYATGAPIASPFTSVPAWDIITDFTHNEDKLDLSQLNTRLTGAGPSVLAWLGEKGTDADAGTLNSSRSHGVWTNTDHTFIYADIDGDGQADMKIQVSNVDSNDVNGVNRAPEITVGAGDRAAASLTETNAGRSASGDLTVVDADLTDRVSPSVQSVALSGVTGGLTPANVLSMLTVSPSSTGADPGADNNLHWAFDSSTQAFNFLAAGEQLTLTYTLKADDGRGGSDTQAVAITINGTNDAPSITVGTGDRATASLTETNEGLSTSGKLTVVDADLTDRVSPSVQSVALSGVTGGLTAANVLSMLTVPPSSIAADPGAASNLDWAFDSGMRAFDFLAAGEQLTLTYTLKADDGRGGSDTQAVAITINGTNDAPNITVGAGDRAAASLTETNAGLSTRGDLTVVDVDLTDRVRPSVQSVELSGVTGGLTADVLSMLTVSPGSMRANPGDDNNLHWAFDSDAQAFNFLAAGEQLTLSYTLKVDDGHAGSDTQAVAITINGTNDAPVGVNDTSASAGATAGTEKGGTLNGSGGNNATGNVIANDTDVDGGSPTVSAIHTGSTEGAGTAGTLGSGLAGAHGTLTLAADGSYTYVIDESDVAVQALNSGQTLSDSFNYTVQDAGGRTDTATLTISINGANDAPLGFDDSASATEKGGTNNTSAGSAASGSVLANDTDVDSAGLTVSAIRSGASEGAGDEGTMGAGLAGAHGTLTLAADGSYTYAIDESDAAVQALNDGDTLTDTFNYTVQDAGGLTDTATLTISINGANDAPLGVDDSGSATEKGGTNNNSGGSDATGNVIANDTDVDSGSLTVSAIRAGGTEGAGTAGTLGAGLAGAHGTLTLAADGSYTYVIDDNDAAVQALNSGETLSDTFNYSVQDAGGLTDTALLTISIAGANDAPLGVDDSGSATEKGGTNNDSGGMDATGNVITDGPGTDTDVDNTSGSLVVSQIRTGGTEGAGTVGTLGSGLAGAHGTLTLAADGSYAYVIDENDAAVQALNGGDTLTDSFNYTLQDAGGLTDTAVLTISINGANDAPLGVDDSGSATEKGGTSNDSGGSDATGNVITTGAGADSDVDNTAGSLVVSQILTGSTEGAGTAGTLGAGLAGAHGTLTLAADGSYTYVIDESDAGVQALNDGETLSDSFNYTLQDAGGLTDTATLTISINGANDAPLGVDDSASATEKGGTNNDSGGSEATGNVISNDTDVDSAGLTVSAIRTGSTEGAGTAGTLGVGLAGAHGTLTLAADGSYTYVIDESDAAVQALNSGETLSDTFNYTVQDAGGLTDTATLTISVNGANDAPLGVDDSGSATEKGGTNNDSGGSDATGNVIANDTDVDGGSLTVSAIRTGGTEGAGTAGTLGVGLAGAHGTLTLAGDGSYTYVIDENDAAVQALNDAETLSDSFNYTVQDAGGLTDTATLTISIAGANDVPTMTSGATASTPENVSTATAVYTATAIDPDGPTLVYSFGGGADDSKFSIDGSSGAVTFNVSPNFESPTDTGANNIYDIIVKASDGTLFDTKAVAITVTNLNEAPTAVADIVLTTAGSGATFAIPEAALLANDTDPDSLSLDVAVGSVGAATSGTVVHVAGTGSFGSIRFTDDTAAAGSFQYAATDGSLVGVSATVSVTNAFTATGGVRAIAGTGSDEILIGQAGRDNLNGAGGNDVIVGAGGGDTLVGGAGNDSIVYTVGASSVNTVIIHGDAAAAVAGTDSDTLVLTDAASITLSASNQTSASFTTVTGFENADASRSDAAVILRGSSGANTLIGGSGADGIFGGNGADNLTGAAGADTFVYTAVSNSNNAGFDTITDFTSGSDTIQLTAGITASQGALATATSFVAAHSVAWFLDVATNQTIVYGNPTDDALSAGSAGLGEVHLANTLTLTGGDFVFEALPAGIAGEPIVLALTNPSSDANVQIAVNVSAVPSGWSLNAGINNGDGTWTVHTNDPSALTVTTAAGFVGATVLTVTETWTNVDGSPGRAIVLDNVEAYAPGSPIFAVSTDDHLTGSTAEDLFVFAQPIATDAIDNFDAAADKIDLIGFAGFTSFADLAIANDANGNAVITLGASSQITVLGIDAASLTAGNFEFDVAPVITNIDTITISDGAILPLGGTIENKGTIALDSSGNDTYLQILFRDATLTGGGKVVMSDSDQNVIFGGSGDTALVNHDNIITGAGHLGAGQLALINEGTIIADGSHALVIDTGSYAATNSGTMEATGIGGLVVESALENTGSLWANGGNIILHGDVTGAGSATIGGAATLEFGAASDANVAFSDGAAGMLKLDVSAAFTGTVSGFAAGDSIDLSDVVYAGGMQLSYTANDAGTGGTLIVSDGTHSAHITLMGHYQAAGVQADGQGGTLLAFDAPAVDHNMTGGAGNDALTGGNNNDTLTGGAGEDMLTGGLGDDLFDYNAVSDSGVGAGNRDVIVDFQAHADAMTHKDAIDLSGIDAITGDGDDAFAFVANANPAVNPGVVANSITWYHSGGNTIVQIDNTGDTTAESEIQLAGLHTLGSTDFVL